MHKYLEKYVKMIVRVGVNIQDGQKLMIRCPVDCAYFARLAMQEAYDAGASNVIIRWVDEKSSRIHYLSAPDSAFGIERGWEEEYIKYIIEEKYNLLAVSASDPEALKGVNPDRITKDQKVLSQINKPLSDKLSKSEIQWTIASVPTLAWAKKVFPDASSDDLAMEKMWDAIMKASRIDEKDPVDNWKSHIFNLQQKANFLMQNNFKELHFKNKLGTDLRMQLPDNHIWVSCGEPAGTGHNFIANIPTEEVFTAPYRTGTNGIVYATKPLVHMGDVIDNFWIKFENGKVVEFYAEKNQDLLKELIYTHPNADYLGEIALVPNLSPISQSGILWYNTLYDENASCHIALGRAYPTTVKGTEGKTEEELNEMGVNQSLTHSDFMIGSPDMNITGIKHDGTKVPVFIDGNWA